LAFTSPIAITLSTGAESFVLVSTDGQNKKYRTADGLNELLISHSEKRRNRRTIRLDRRVVTADPFIPANNVEVSYSAYLVIDMPVAGFADADVVTDVSGASALLAYLDGTTVIADLLAGAS
jgi:hypothetical protein